MTTAVLHRDARRVWRRSSTTPPRPDPDLRPGPGPAFAPTSGLVASRPAPSPFHQPPRPASPRPAPGARLHPRPVRAPRDRSVALPERRRTNDAGAPGCDGPRGRDEGRAGARREGDPCRDASPLRRPGKCRPLCLRKRTQKPFGSRVAAGAARAGARETRRARESRPTGQGPSASQTPGLPVLRSGPWKVRGSSAEGVIRTRFSCAGRTTPAGGPRVPSVPDRPPPVGPSAAHQGPARLPPEGGRWEVGRTGLGASTRPLGVASARLGRRGSPARLPPDFVNGSGVWTSPVLEGVGDRCRPGRDSTPTLPDPALDLRVRPADATDAGHGDPGGPVPPVLYGPCMDLPTSRPLPLPGQKTGVPVVNRDLSGRPNVLLPSRAVPPQTRGDWSHPSRRSRNGVETKVDVLESTP